MKPTGLVVSALHKTGTMFIYRLFAELSSKLDNSVLASQNNAARDEHICEAVLQSGTNCILAPRRSFKSIDEFWFERSSPKFLFVLRDPRDLIVSQFYSQGFTHSDKDWNKEAIVRERILRKEVDLDEFAYHHGVEATNEAYGRPFMDRCDDIFLTLEQIKSKTGPDSLLICKYEEMVTDYEAWLRRVLEFLGFENRFEHLYNTFSHQFVSKRRESIGHIRKMSPGDFTEKLNGDTIRRIDKRLHHFIEAFEYDIDIDLYEVDNTAESDFWHYFHTGYYYSSTDPELAMRSFTRATEIKEAYGEPYRQLGELSRKNGSGDDAFRYFEIAAEKDPENPLALEAYADELTPRAHDSADRQAIVALYKKAIDLTFDGDDGNYNPKLAVLRTKLAAQLTRSGDTQEAILQYKAAVANHLEWRRPYFALIPLLEEAGDIDGAIEYSSGQLDQPTVQPIDILNHARLLIRAKREKESFAISQKAELIDEGHGKLLVNLAHEYWNAGLSDEAISALGRVVSSYPHIGAYKQQHNQWTAASRSQRIGESARSDDLRS